MIDAFRLWTRLRQRCLQFGRPVPHTVVVTSHWLAFPAHSCGQLIRSRVVFLYCRDVDWLHPCGWDDANFFCFSAIFVYWFSSDPLLVDRFPLLKGTELKSFSSEPALNRCCERLQVGIALDFVLLITKVDVFSISQCSRLTNYCFFQLMYPVNWVSWYVIYHRNGRP
jgi:hypothetical protein